MPYIKAYIKTYDYGDVNFNEGGFYTHGIKAVLGERDTTEIVLDRQLGYTSKAIINLPPDKVNILLGRLEIQGGILDLLAHTKPENPASAETPVPHITARDQELTIDFNNLAGRDERAKRPLLPSANKAAGRGPATAP